MAKSSNKTKKRRKTSKKKGIGKNAKRIRQFAIGALVFIAACWICHVSFRNEAPIEVSENELPKVCERVNENYGTIIDSCARVVGLSSAYLKALACLECSGRTDMPKRFEKHVYKRLKNVREGKLASYEGVTSAMIQDASDDALKNLATSWGPFQIMGYKCLHLHINVADLRGKDAVYWGVKWIKGEYGHLLQKGRYRDAFHYHNTGRVYPADGKPTTYDKNYVPNGLTYMRCFGF